MARRLSALVLCGTLACAGGHPAPEGPPPVAPLPTAGLAGGTVAVTPLTLLAASDSLPWQAELADRRLALVAADSVVGALLESRSPEVTWVLPDALRRAASRAPGVLANPDQLGTAMLRDARFRTVPDPLRAQLRALAGVAGSRWVLVPAALLYQPDPLGGRAELTLALVDARTGVVGWRTVARGVGSDPWSALTAAVKLLHPGLP